MEEPQVVYEELEEEKPLQRKSQDLQLIVEIDDSEHFSNKENLPPGLSVHTQMHLQQVGKKRPFSSLTLSTTVVISASASKYDPTMCTLCNEPILIFERGCTIKRCRHRAHVRCLQQSSPGKQCTVCFAKLI